MTARLTSQGRLAHPSLLVSRESKVRRRARSTTQVAPSASLPRCFLRRVNDISLDRDWHSKHNQWSRPRRQLVDRWVQPTYRAPERRATRRLATAQIEPDQFLSPLHSGRNHARL